MFPYKFDGESVDLKLHCSFPLEHSGAVVGSAKGTASELGSPGFLGARPEIWQKRKMTLRSIQIRIGKYKAYTISYTTISFYRYNTHLGLSPSRNDTIAVSRGRRRTLPKSARYARRSPSRARYGGQVGTPGGRCAARHGCGRPGCRCPCCRGSNPTGSMLFY